MSFGSLGVCQALCLNSPRTISLSFCSFSAVPWFPIWLETPIRFILSKHYRLIIKFLKLPMFLYPPSTLSYFILIELINWLLLLFYFWIFDVTNPSLFQMQMREEWLQLESKMHPATEWARLPSTDSYQGVTSRSTGAVHSQVPRLPRGLECRDLVWMSVRMGVRQKEADTQAGQEHRLHAWRGEYLKKQCAVSLRHGSRTHGLIHEFRWREGYE